MENEFSLKLNDNVTLSVPILYQNDNILSEIAEGQLNILPFVTYTFATVTLVVIWYFLFWRPFNWIRDFSDLGFDDVKVTYPNIHTQKAVIDGIRRRKKIGDLPPIYPNGWFIILETDQLSKKTTKQVNVLGLNLLVWRGESEKSYVADAFCTSEGIDLNTLDGEVNEEDVVYHSKRLSLKSLDGKLRTFSYPTLFESDELADIKLWDSMEMNGFIYLWYHAEGECPNWRPPVFPQIESGEWKYRGRSEFKVSCHIQEIPENGADVSHLNVVHKPAMMTGGKPNDAAFKWSFLKHVWNASWTANELPGEEYKALMKVHHHVSVFNKISLMNMDVEAHQIGPGLVFLEFNGFFGKGILFFMVTPLEPLLQKITHRFYSSNSMLHPFGMLILLGEAIQLERDIAIWNRKTFINRPLLTKEDKAIKSFRRWFHQFYSENSPKYAI